MVGEKTRDPCEAAVTEEGESHENDVELPPQPQSKKVEDDTR